MYILKDILIVNNHISFSLSLRQFFLGTLHICI